MQIIWDYPIRNNNNLVHSLLSGFEDELTAILNTLTTFLTKMICHITDRRKFQCSVLIDLLFKY